MAIPPISAFMLPFLELLADQREHSYVELEESIAVRLGLSEDDRKKRLASDQSTVVYSHIAWVKTDFGMAKLLEATGRGKFRITARGLQVLQEHPTRITRKYLKRFPEFVEFQRKRESSSLVAPTATSDQDRKQQDGMTTATIQKESSAAPQDVSSTQTAEPGQKLHTLMEDRICEIGKILGKFPDKEYRKSPPYIYDAIWRDYRGAPRPSHVFEVQDKGSLDSALAKLKHACDIWKSHAFLLVTDERDRARLAQLVEGYLDGTYHELAGELTIISVDDVNDVYEMLGRQKELIMKLLKK